MKHTVAELFGFVIAALILGAVIAGVSFPNIETFFRHYFDSGTPKY